MSNKKALTYIQLQSVKERELFFREQMTPILGDTAVSMMLYKGFCSVPASLNHHGNYEGGLFDHSLAVACCLQRYTDKLDLAWTVPESPIRIGMLHDLCKIDQYIRIPMEDSMYEWNDKPIVKGHGSKSVIYALRYGCKLTEEEIACIIYHMGAFEKDCWEDYSNALTQFPNVLYTHTADMEVSQIQGV